MPVPIGGSASGGDQTVSDNGVTISLAAGATATVTGNNDTVNASGSGSSIDFGETQEAASISSGTVNFASGAGGTVTGLRDCRALRRYDPPPLPSSHGGGSPRP